MDRYLLMETEHKKMPSWQKNLEVVGREILNEHITLCHSSGAGHCSSLFPDCVRKADNICLPDERTWIFWVQLKKKSLYPSAAVLTGNTAHFEHKNHRALFMSPAWSAVWRAGLNSAETVPPVSAVRYEPPCTSDLVFFQYSFSVHGTTTGHLNSLHTCRPNLKFFQCLDPSEA